MDDNKKIAAQEVPVQEQPNNSKHIPFKFVNKSFIEGFFLGVLGPTILELGKLLIHFFKK